MTEQRMPTEPITRPVSENRASAEDAGVESAWQRFWFRPVPTSTLGVLRIAFGSLALVWFLSLIPDVSSFFTAEGILPSGRPGWTSVLGTAPPPVAVYGLLAVGVVGSACLAIGYHARLAAVAVFVTTSWFERRNGWVMNGGDLVLRNLAFFMMLAPSGAALSVDRWRQAKGAFWEFPLCAPWALRLFQLQVSTVYVATVLAKLRGEDWHDGTAVSYALRLTEMSRFPLPETITNSLLLSNLLTFGTLAAEGALAVLLWKRRALPWVLATGILLHLGIDALLLVGFFSFTMLVAYLAFVPPDVMTRGVHGFAAWLGHRRLPKLRSLPPTTGALPG